jgi:hypothetical protein
MAGFIDALNELVNEFGDTSVGNYVYGALDKTYRAWNPTEEMKQEILESRGITPEARARKEWAFDGVPQLNVFDRTPEQQARIDAWKFETRRPGAPVGDHWLASILDGSWLRNSSTPESRWMNHPGNPDNPNNTRSLAGLGEGQTIDDVLATGQAIQQSLETGTVVSPSVAPMTQEFRDRLIRMSGQPVTGRSPLTARQMNQIFGTTRSTADRPRGNDIPLAERYNTLFGRTPGTLGDTSSTATTPTQTTTTTTTGTPKQIEAHEVDTSDIESVLDHIAPVLDIFMDKGYLGPGLAETLDTPESRRAFYRTLMESEGFDMEGLLNRFNLNNPVAGTTPTTQSTTPTQRFTGDWLANVSDAQLQQAARDPYTAARFVLHNEGIEENSILYNQLLRNAPQIHALFLLQGPDGDGSTQKTVDNYLRSYVKYLNDITQTPSAFADARNEVIKIAQGHLRGLSDPTSDIYNQLVPYEGVSVDSAKPWEYEQPGARNYSTAADLYWGALFEPILTAYGMNPTHVDGWKRSLQKLYQDYEVDKMHMEKGKEVPFALYMLENYRLVPQLLAGGQ